MAFYESKVKPMNLKNPEPLLNQKAGVPFHNFSQFTFQKLKADSDNVATNPKNFINEFSAAGREIIEYFNFNDHINRLDEANLLFLINQKFAEAVHLKRAIASSDYGISNQLEPIGKYPVLRMGNLQNGEVVMDSVKYVDEVDPLLVLKSNDILFNRTNSLDLVGKVALFRADPGVEVTFASYLVRFRSNVLAIPAYLVLFLGRQDVQKIVRAMALPAIGQVNLNPNRYGYLQICLPPCSEQIEIVAWLREKMRKLQELINKNNNQIKKLQEYRQSLITAAVTGKIDTREKDAA